MATGLTFSDTSNLSSGQKILVAAAKNAFEPAAPNPDLVSNETIPQGHKQWDILTNARLSDASELTEANDLAQSQQLVAASLSITPSEHGIIATISRRLIRRQGDQNVLSNTGVMLANSLRRLMDKNVITLFDGFSKSIVGTSNALDITFFRGGTAYLLTDNDSAYGPAPLPLKASLHIEQISDIIVDITDTAPRGTTIGITGDMLNRWWRGTDRLYGISIFHSGNIARDQNGDSKGAIFAEMALVLVMANTAEATEQPDHSARVLELGVFQEWGEGERADPHGVEVFSDTTATV